MENFKDLLLTFGWKELYPCVQKNVDKWLLLKLKENKQIGELELNLMLRIFFGRCMEQVIDEIIAERCSSSKKFAEIYSAILKIEEALKSLEILILEKILPKIKEDIQPFLNFN